MTDVVTDVVKVMIGVPNESYVHWRSHNSFIDMAFHLGRQVEKQEQQQTTPRLEISWVTIGRYFTPMAREIMCTQALEMNMDYILMMDSDMLFDKDIVFKLLQHQKDIVACLAFTRKTPHLPVCYQIDTGYDAHTHQEWFKTRPILNYPKDQLFRCDAVGFGAVLIHTQVLRSLAKPWFMNTNPAGEDILFCVNAGKTGFKVYMDSSVKSAHLGEELLITEEYVHQQNPDREKQNQYIKEYATNGR